MKIKSIDISSKKIILATTLILSLSYVGLVVIYAEGLVNNMDHTTVSYGRNDTKNTEYSVDQDPESLNKLKIDLEKQLRQANLMLNVLEDKNQNKRQGI